MHRRSKLECKASLRRIYHKLRTIWYSARQDPGRPPFGGLKPYERRFVKQFDNWKIAVENYRLQEKLLLQELISEERAKFNTGKRIPSKSTQGGDAQK